MNQQEIYDLCIEYGACVEAYIQQSIKDARAGDGHDDGFAASMILLETNLAKLGVKIDSDERMSAVKERIQRGLQRTLLAAGPVQFGLAASCSWPPFFSLQALGKK